MIWRPLSVTKPLAGVPYAATHRIRHHCSSRAFFMISLCFVESSPKSRSTSACFSRSASLRRVAAAAQALRLGARESDLGSSAGGVRWGSWEPAGCRW
eukprot:7379430-Prymnesium_polylepis.1